MEKSNTAIQYDYEPIFNDIKYLKLQDDKEEVYDHYSCFWVTVNVNQKELEKYFEELYKKLIDNNQYFLGCPFKIYARTYKQRLKNYIECYSDIGSSEIDFIEYEINNNEKIKEYEYVADSRTWEEIEESMNRRKEYLKRRTKKLGYQIASSGGRYSFTKIETKNNLSHISVEQNPINENVQNIDINPLVDLSDTINMDKIRYLHELGIIDYLRKKEPFSTSTNSLATVISAFTGIKTTTIQSYINPMFNDDTVQRNNPLSNINKMDKVRRQLIEIGFKPSK